MPSQCEPCPLSVATQQYSELCQASLCSVLLTFVYLALSLGLAQGCQCCVGFTETSLLAAPLSMQLQASTNLRVQHNPSYQILIWSTCSWYALELFKHQIGDYDKSGKTRARQAAIVVSTGQYGHLKLRLAALAIFTIAPLDRTCPQGSIMAGLLGSVCSRDTGHAKIVWKTNSGPSSISTGS